MWEDIEIVDLDTAKMHVRCTTTDQDDLDEIYLAQAHGLVLDYIARASDEEWTAEMLAWDSDTAPRAVQAAILRQFADLRRFRGDDDTEPKFDAGFLSPRVKQLLLMYRDPVIG